MPKLLQQGIMRLRDHGILFYVKRSQFLLLSLFYFVCSCFSICILLVAVCCFYALIAHYLLDLLIHPICIAVRSELETPRVFCRQLLNRNGSCFKGGVSNDQIPKLDWCPLCGKGLAPMPQPFRHHDSTKYSLMQY